MHDPGDESDTPADAFIVDTQPARVPPGGDPHVGEGGDPVYIDPGPVADRLEVLADFLHAASHDVRRQRDELRRKDAKLTLEAKRNLHARLRRMGFEVDQELGRGLP